MILCSCTALTDDDVRLAAASGVRVGREVHAACGKKRDCNGCLPVICAMLREAKVKERAGGAEVRGMHALLPNARRNGSGNQDSSSPHSYFPLSTG